MKTRWRNDNDTNGQRKRPPLCEEMEKWNFISSQRRQHVWNMRRSNSGLRRWQWRHTPPKYSTMIPIPSNFEWLAAASATLYLFELFSSFVRCSVAGISFCLLYLMRRTRYRTQYSPLQSNGRSTRWNDTQWLELMSAIFPECLSFSTGEFNDTNLSGFVWQSI